MILHKTINLEEFVKEKTGENVSLEKKDQLSANYTLYRFSSEKVHMVTDGAGGYKIIINPELEKENPDRQYINGIFN